MKTVAKCYIDCEKLVFHMLLSGIARVEPNTKEFCYRGLRHQYGAWEHIVNYYGVDSIQQAMANVGYEIKGW